MIVEHTKMKTICSLRSEVVLLTVVSSQRQKELRIAKGSNLDCRHPRVKGEVDPKRATGRDLATEVEGTFTF